MKRRELLTGAVATVLASAIPVLPAPVRKTVTYGLQQGDVYFQIPSSWVLPDPWERIAEWNVFSPSHLYDGIHALTLDDAIVVVQNDDDADVAQR